MMNSGTQAKLPVIDFSNPNLKPGSPEWDLVKFQVRQALEEYSCFEASFDQVVELRNAVFGAMEEVFDLPLEIKKLYVSDKPFRGYFGHQSKLLESMMIDEAKSAENIEQRLTTTLWPHGNISFSKTLVSFTELASRLEKTIRRIIFEIFGVEKYIDEHIDSTNYLLKLMKYNAPQTNEPTIGAVAHNDMNTVTLLYQNEVDGLQIQNKDGDWINVQPSPNSFIGSPLNIKSLGPPLLQIWLNGGLSATYHRVVVKGNNTRYSAGLFAASRGGYQVKAPEELVDEKNPMLFKPFDYEEFLGFYLTQVAPGGARTGLTTYCSAKILA
ncbi:putative 2-oxoglutarate (2OG) and Fe(II)-dependent oxygenase superfamily protein [Hibiscus syriacus]|uniref:2-oxoglutarate (2OG) and Fe(II)-dependent oxygenase superfamily protein n=1 Tax=Hibiscus syriacus TaxID=106335 RepID=A0A6A3AQC1_HIBSY|nr:putative 2-oxoglutarate (2OG) and Fe(II)-dependent oxygenase superfamily protein [Hibiscus syriacus]